jgi:hypothetical protein
MSGYLVAAAAASLWPACARAKLALGLTEVRGPTDGRIGRKLGSKENRGRP